MRAAAGRASIGLDAMPTRSFGAVDFGALVLYFLPTLIALLRGSRRVPTFFINLLLGWTVIGWIVALVMALTGGRAGAPAQVLYGPPAGYAPQMVGPQVVAPPPPTMPTMSPDRQFWWDGRAWQNAAISVPPGVTYSADGREWWDGTEWRMAPGR